MIRYTSVFIFGAATGILFNKYICSLLHKKGINRRYNLIALVNGLLYLWIYKQAGQGAESFLFCLCASLLLIISIVDAKTFEIPLECNMFIGLLGAARLILFHEGWMEYFTGIFAASGIFLGIFILTGGERIGGGDIKLMAAAGLFLGGWKILLALFLGSLAAIVCRLPMMKFANKSRYFAYGPYLSLGILIAMLYGDEIINHCL